MFYIYFIFGDTLYVPGIQDFHCQYDIGIVPQYGASQINIALLWNLASYLQSATTRQHRREQPWPGPTRACAHFTYFNKTAITKKLSHL